MSDGAVDIETHPLYVKIVGALERTFGIASERIRPEAKIRDELDLDSIDLFDLIGILETDYGVQLDVDQFKGVDTLRSLVERVATLLPPRSHAA